MTVNAIGDPILVNGKAARLVEMISRAIIIGNYNKANKIFEELEITQPGIRFKCNVNKYILGI